MDRMPIDRCRMPTAMWRAIEDVGLPPAAVLRQARLPAAFHLDPHAILTTAQFFELWRAVETLSGDPNVAMRMLEAARSAGYQPLFLAACYAADFRDGLARILRFKRLTTCEQVDSEERDGTFTLFKRWPHATGPEPLILVQLSFAFALELGRRGTGLPIAPIRVEFSHSGPRSPECDTFYGVPARYGATGNRLVLASADLDRPFPGHNPELLAILTPALTAALSADCPEETVAERVKTTLKQRLAGGRPDVGAIARDLGMSERTLQRRITEEGTSFRTLLAEARREMSRALLAEPGTEIDEVACLLGYQDKTSFYRAFRDWEGITPGKWLAQNGPGAAAAAARAG
ncbi:AraC family transcriptional regulator [Prosthecomicrobium pneumaticum]|uniref:AraC-like DNA-binding protein n=1 Tax=Prosthecomicrobium pneumaticum TaxID=81895 RepID=A0A7W9CVN8_9HYPH|nr:AraC family transcriptional regulator [Prosthecomicrobium pneumaticum]MBB5752207.1 AraC-like DNA-binding protein [Prosthecomicrobium pneumaticum]